MYNNKKKFKTKQIQIPQNQIKTISVIDSPKGFPSPRTSKPHTITIPIPPRKSDQKVQSPVYSDLSPTARIFKTSYKKPIEPPGYGYTAPPPIPTHQMLPHNMATSASYITSSMNNKEPNILFVSYADYEKVWNHQEQLKFFRDSVIWNTNYYIATTIQQAQYNYMASFRYFPR